MYYMSAPLIIAWIALLSVERIGSLPSSPWLEALRILLWMWLPAAFAGAARLFAPDRLRLGVAAAKGASFGAFLYHTLVGFLPELINAAMAWFPLSTMRLAAAFIPLAGGMLLIDAAAGQLRLHDWTRRLKFQILPILPIMGYIVLLDLFEYAPFPVQAAVMERPWLMGAGLLAFLGFTYAFAPALLRRLWRATPLEEGELAERARRLAERRGVSYRRLAVWHAGPRFLNAAVAGLFPRRREIFISEGLLNVLNTDEMESVVAHEMGHVKRGHLWLYLLFSLSYIAVSLLLFAALNPYWPEWWTESGIATAFTGAAFFFVYFALLFGFVSRQFERQADQFAAVNACGPTTYARALSKLHEGSRSSSSRLSRWLRWLRTHPPIEERVEFALRAGHGDPLASAYAKPLWVSKALAGAAPLLLLALILFRGAYLPTAAEAAEAVSRLYLKEAETAALEIEQTPEDSEKREELSRRRLRLIAVVEERAVKGLEIDPENESLAYLQGAASMRMNKIDAAEAAFERALANNPEHLEALVALARVRMEQGRRLDAADLLKRAAEALGGYRNAFDIIEEIQGIEQELRDMP